MHVGNLFAYYVTNGGLRKVLDPVLYTLMGDVDEDFGIVTERDIEDADAQAYDRDVCQGYGYIRYGGVYFNRRWFNKDADTWK